MLQKRRLNCPNKIVQTMKNRLYLKFGNIVIKNEINNNNERKRNFILTEIKIKI